MASISKDASSGVRPSPKMEVLLCPLKVTSGAAPVDIDDWYVASGSNTTMSLSGKVPVPTTTCDSSVPVGLLLLSLRCTIAPLGEPLTPVTCPPLNPAIEATIISQPSNTPSSMVVTSRSAVVSPTEISTEATPVKSLPSLAVPE